MSMSLVRECATAATVAAAESMLFTEPPGPEALAVAGLMGEVLGSPVLGWGDGVSLRSSVDIGSNSAAISSFFVSGRFLEGERGSNAGSVLTCGVEKQGE